MRPLATVFVVFITCLLTYAHAHEHGESNPAYKYSREANQKPIADEDEIFEEDIVDLPPQQAHFQGRSHGGHSHGGHSHGDHMHQEELSPAERKKRRERLLKIWDDDEEEETLGRNVWIKAIGATLLISAAPFFILFLIPLDSSKEKQWLMKIFLSFASGGLLGDAFLHLIPHAMMATGNGESHSHSHGHGGDGHGPHDMSVGLGVLSGIVAFLCVEKMVRIFTGGHAHSHSASDPVEKKEEPKRIEKKLKDVREERVTDKDEDKNDDEDKGKEKRSKEVDDDNEKALDPGEEPSEMKVAGFLNLFADCFHNFTDGLAIGASFVAGESVGIVTTLTILVHEIPHEIGDYAILIQSGVAPKKAIMLQLLTAVGALTGCVVSLLAHGGDLSGSSAFILPFTAGGFIYIATVAVIPDILKGTSTLKQSLLEIAALLAGVAMMVLIAQYE